MPLFICEKCECVDNTALGSYWSRNIGVFDAPFNIALCSECAPLTFNDGTKTGYSGKWHGKFEKLHYKEFLKQYPSAEFVNINSFDSDGK